MAVTQRQQRRGSTQARWATADWPTDDPGSRIGDRPRNKETRGNLAVPGTRQLTESTELRHRSLVRPWLTSNCAQPASARHWRLDGPFNIRKRTVQGRPAWISGRLAAHCDTWRPLHFTAGQRIPRQPGPLVAGAGTDQTRWTAPGAVSGQPPPLGLSRRTLMGCSLFNSAPRHCRSLPRRHCATLTAPGLPLTRFTSGRFEIIERSPATNRIFEQSCGISFHAGLGHLDVLDPESAARFQSDQARRNVAVSTQHKLSA